MIRRNNRRDRASLLGVDVSFASPSQKHRFVSSQRLLFPSSSSSAGPRFHDARSRCDSSTIYRRLFQKEKTKAVERARALSPSFLSLSLSLFLSHSHSLSLSLRACFSRRRDRGTKEECRRKEGGASGLFLNSKNKKCLGFQSVFFFIRLDWADR